MMTLSPINPDLFYPIMAWPWIAQEQQHPQQEQEEEEEDPNTQYHYLHPNPNTNSILPYTTQTSESIVFADYPYPNPNPNPQQLIMNNEIKVNSSEGNVTGVETPTSLKAKKLNHNASERDRRKRINDLYSSLRCLLPASDHKKKLSIPATVSRVVKYIPELQKEVEKLIRQKDEITSRISKEKKSSTKLNHGGAAIDEKKKKKKMACSVNIISAREIGEKEVTIQICAAADDESEKKRFSEALQTLEEVGLILLGVSCFTSGKMIFRNIHLLKVEEQGEEGSQSIECDALEREVLYLYQNINL